jgi:thimet oligopeptidase
MPTIARHLGPVACLLWMSAAGAQEPAQQPVAPAQPTLWATRPDADAFAARENERIAAAQRSIEQLLAVQGQRTIANTLGPYDEAIRQLNAANDFAAVMQAVHPDAAFRDRATAMTAAISDVQAGLALNQAVYQALAGLDASQADAATRYYLQRQLLEFRLAGVDKDQATRTRLKALQDRLTDDLSAFDRNINDDVRTIEVASVAALDGLPQDFIDNHKPGADGKIRLTTNYPDLWPVIAFAHDDALRRSLWLAWTSRAYPKNRAVLEDMMQARHEIATLLGYPSWADYSAADKMMVN